MGCAIFRAAEPTQRLLSPGSEDDKICTEKMAEKFTKITKENPKSMKAQDVLCVFQPRDIIKQGQV